MSDEQERQATQIFRALRRHTRIAYQGIVSSAAQLEALRTTLPFFVPFQGAIYSGFLPILDWDHKLPSRSIILRLYAYYSAAALEQAEAEFCARSDQITSRDTFPEFDVPDFSGMAADESYEAEVETSGRIQQMRLVSAWRRDIDNGDAHSSVQLARHSEEFRKLSAMVRKRPDYLGDLEAVSWTPPCETSHPSWTIDVWYLTDLNSSVGKGRSFLVDLQLRRVFGVREFVVRSG
jgi:hypothetical protein